MFSFIFGDGGGGTETFSLFQIQPKIWQEINSDKQHSWRNFNWQVEMF